MKQSQHSVHGASYQSRDFSIASVLAVFALATSLGCSTEDANVDAIDGEGAQSASIKAATTHLLTLRGGLGLDSNHDVALRKQFTDERGETHVRFEQTYQNVKVWHGDAIVHLDKDAQPLSVTQTMNAGINLSVKPSFGPEVSKGIADRDLNPIGKYVRPLEAELVIFPETVRVVRPERLRGPKGELNAVDVEEQTVGYSLAYHVHAELENGTPETSHTDYMIDAHSGAILKKWSTLLTASADGSGKSQYSGTVGISTNTVTSGYELRDVTRATSFATYNLNHGTNGTGTIYTDADNTWGDGADYSGGSTTAANGQTAGVDAHYGVAKTLDFYANVNGRNGIDDAGGDTYSRVHYSTNYDNAFWSDDCFCMTYGDGSSFSVLTSLDVAGHELTHGVTSETANLTYSGESGGLNEAISDINGTMVEFYARGGNGSVIGNTGGNWTIGEQLDSVPLRYMYKPSLDGGSRDAWSSSLGSIDVHYSSGPLNRAFYFLSQGSSSTSSSNFYSSYLPGGMTGIGNDEAARIVYRALTVYLSSNSNYAAARTAFVNAATDLYGATSAEVVAVENAFAAINVGASTGGGTGGGGTAVAEVEPNNSRSAAQAISTTNSTVNGTFSSSSDTDYFAVQLASGATLTATLQPNASSDYDLYVYNSSGSQIGASELSVGDTDQVSVSNSGSSTVTRYVRVKYYSGSTGASGTYTLNLTF